MEELNKPEKKKRKHILATSESLKSQLVKIRDLMGSSSEIDENEEKFLVDKIESIEEELHIRSYEKS